MADNEIASFFVTGLRDAHAMENQALAIMRPQAQRIENYPEVAAVLAQHIAETETQITGLETILDRLDKNKSAIKDFALSAAGGLAALAHTGAPDEIIKNSLANNAFENFEIAAYKSLIAIAEELGDTEAVSLLTEGLDEEIIMADWLDQNIEMVTLRYIALRAAGETAKK